MTIKNALTLRNIYILLCCAVLFLIGIKGYDINRKIDWVAEAERYYDRQDLIGAEEWYQKAGSNRSIHYKESLIASRLRELAPITSMKQTLSQLDERAKRTSSSQDFTGFMNVYSDLLAAKSKYMGSDNKFANYYPKISAMYGISDKVTEDLKQFKTLFYQQADDQLRQGQYDDNSFKWNLLTIPDAYYGSKADKQKQLNAKFKTYDETLMTRMAASGQYQAMLDWSLSMMNQYNSHTFKASWVTRRTEDLARMILEKDVEGGSAANFASHAKIYTAFMNNAGMKKSDVLVYIGQQVQKWLKSAAGKVKNHQYEEAIAIYEALAGYQNTADEIKSAKLAWTIHDPVRLLKSVDASRSYDYVSGGASRFGGKAYAMGVDDQNVIYFAKLNSDETTQLLSSQNFPKDVAIRQISIEASLSTKSNPVILVEADSPSRNTMFAAYEVQGDRMVQLFLFSADAYQVQPDKTLLVTNPESDGPLQHAIYERHGDSYEFAGYQQDYTDIAATDLLGHSNEKVRFTIYIVQGGQGEALAEMEGSYVRLRGNFEFAEGSITVIGTFSQFEDIYPDGDQTGELITVPVVEVESVE